MSANRASTWIWAAMAAWTASPTLAAPPAQIPAGAIAVQSNISDMDWVRQVQPIPRGQAPTAVDGRKFPKIWLGSFRYEYSEKLTRYRITPSLRSISRHFYNFQMIPQVRSADGKLQELADGYYLLRMVLLRPELPRLELQIDGNLDEDQKSAVALYDRFITSAERLVQVQQGTIRASVALDIPYVSALNLRNTMLLQIVPVRADKLEFNERGLVKSGSPVITIEPAAGQMEIMKVPFIPRISSGLSTPIPPIQEDEFTQEHDLNLKIFANEARKFKERLEQVVDSPLQADGLAQKMGVQRIKISELERLAQDSLAGPSTRGFSRAELFQLLSGQSNSLPEEWAELFCRKIVRDTYSESRHFVEARNRLVRCAHEGIEALRLTKLVFPKDTPNALIDHAQGGALRLALSTNNLKNRSKSLDVILGLNGGLGLADLFGSLRLSGSWNVNRTQSRSQSEGSMFSSALDLELTYWDLPLEFREAAVCLSVQPNRKRLDLPERAAGFMVCESQSVTNLRTVERYIHVSSMPNTASSIDAFDPRNQVANHSLRGLDQYQQLLASVVEVLHPVHRPNETPIDEFSKSLRLLKDVMPSQPGVIAQTIYLRGPRTERFDQLRRDPTFLQRLVGQYSEDFVR